MSRGRALGLTVVLGLLLVAGSSLGTVMGLMVRPGEGAWVFAGGDGGPRDEDGQSDGHLRFALDKLDPLPGSPAAPSKLNGQDLWLWSIR